MDGVGQKAGTCNYSFLNGNAADNRRLDPFFEILTHHTGSSVLLYRSEFVRQTLKPTWKPFTLTLDMIKGPSHTPLILVIQANLRLLL